MSSEEERREREMQQSLQMHKEVDQIIGSHYMPSHVDQAPKFENIENMDAETIRILEANNREKSNISIGRKETEEERREREMQQSLQMHREVDQIMGSHYMPSHVDQAPRFKNIENMDTETLRILRANADEKRESEKPMYDVIDNIINNGIPKNYDQLKEMIGEYAQRKDFRKNLLEKSLSKLELSIKDWSNFEDRNLDKQINNAVFEYLSIVSTLVDLKSDLKSPKFGQYDPYYVDLKLGYLSDVMQKRRKGNCNIDIDIPKKYNIEKNTSQLDSVRCIYFIEREIDGQIINWDKYVNPVEKKDAVDNFISARKQQMEEDELQRLAKLQNAENIDVSQKRGFSK